MPKDIEDIVQLGKELHVCPYYAARNSLKQAEVSGKAEQPSKPLNPLLAASYPAV